MQATTTDLTAELRTALTAHGVSPDSADTITALLPPAGRHALTGWLDSPTAVRDITAGFIGEVAAKLRITWADAALIRCELKGATR